MYGKAFLAWLVYVVVTGGLWYLLSEDETIWSSLCFGAIVGLIGAGIYLYQQRKKRAE